MFLFYIYGSGLGHLNRVLNFIFSEKVPLKNCAILTNSEFCNYLPKEITTINKSADFFKNVNKFNLFLENLIVDKQISTLVIDVFPAGFYGEFSNSFQNLNVKTILLARILKDSYFSNFSIPNYETIYLMENGIDTKKLSAKNIKKYNLRTRLFIEKTVIKLYKPFFLIIHSTPSEEVFLLYKQALLYRTIEHIYIQTYAKINFSTENTTIIQQKRTNPILLKYATKIFSGCGFNIISETKKYRKKQVIIPFKRKYDNQFKRYSLLKKNSL